MTESFAQRTLLLPVLDTVSLVDARAEIGGIAAEGDLEARQELVHAREQALRRRRRRVDGGLALKHNDTVREVRRHDEIVLDDESGLLGVHDEALDDA